MKKAVVVFIACILVSYAYGQSVQSFVVSTAGNSVETTDVKVSWTVGEVAVETIGEKGVTPVLSQGFQQGYFSITSIGDPISDNYSINVYPNPASEFLWVDVKSDERKDVLVEIYNLEGKLVLSEKWEFVSGPNKIIISDLSSTQYILTVSEPSGKILQTFKLVKR